MNDETMKWIAELERAAKIRTPVGATYAVALALMHVAMQIERIAENGAYPNLPMREDFAKGKK
jgi:hypothetical protein